MAHFARLDENNIVTQVIVVANDNCFDSEGIESETVGAKFCSDLLGGRWIQTSFNHRIRGRYAGLGFSYNEELDIFIAPQPNADWVLNEDTYEWFPPNG